MKLLKKNLISSALVAEHRLIGFSMEKPSGAENVSKSPDGNKFDLGKRLDETIAKLTKVKDKMNDKKENQTKITLDNIEQTVANDKELQNALKSPGLQIALDANLQKTLNDKDAMAEINKIDTNPGA